MLNSSIWRAVLSLFYPPVIIQGKNGKNSESPVGSNKSEKRKPKSAVYRSILASVVYFHIRLISTRRHKREMTRNQFVGNHTRVRIPPAAPYKQRSKFGSQKRGRQMPASFLCHKHSTKASFHGLSSFTKRVAQKEKTGKSFCQNSCKAFFEPGGLIFNRYLFCSVYPEKDKP